MANRQSIFSADATTGDGTWVDVAGGSYLLIFEIEGGSTVSATFKYRRNTTGGEFAIKDSSGTVTLTANDIKHLDLPEGQITANVSASDGQVDAWVEVYKAAQHSFSL